MPRVCSVCTRPEVAQIDTELSAGTSLRAVAARFGTSKSAVERHRGEGQASTMTVNASAPVLPNATEAEPPADSGHLNGAAGVLAEVGTTQAPTETVILSVPGPHSVPVSEEVLHDPAPMLAAPGATVAGQGFPGFPDAQRAGAREDGSVEYSAPKKEEECHAEDDAPGSTTMNAALADARAEAHATIRDIDARLPSLDRRRRALVLDVKLGQAIPADLEALASEITALQVSRDNMLGMLVEIEDRERQALITRRQEVIAELDRILGDLETQRDAALDEIRNGPRAMSATAIDRAATLEKQAYGLAHDLHGS